MVKFIYTAIIDALIFYRLMVVREQTRSKSFLVKFRIWNDLKVV